MKKSFGVAKVFLVILLWIGLLHLVAKLSLYAPQSIDFPYYNTDLARYTRAEAIWAHFDGIHYLRLASYGYRDTGTQAFFPIYPALVSALKGIGLSPLYSALLISYCSLFFAIWGIRVLFPSRFWPTFLTLLLFPTSFFLVSVYTESLFLALVIWFFVFLKAKKWGVAALLSGIASGTRLVGILLALSLAVEFFRSYGPKAFKRPSLLLLLLLSCGGLIGYMWFLLVRFQDPFMFFHVQPMFGAGRSGSEIILLPQVIYRYLKMIFTVDSTTLLYQRVWLELMTTLAVIYLLFKNYKRIVLSQTVFLAGSILLPTLTGSLSSMPRYALVLVPFLVAGSRPRLVLIPFGLLLIYLFSVFASGQFVA